MSIYRFSSKRLKFLIYVVPLVVTSCSKSNENSLQPTQPATSCVANPSASNSTQTTTNNVLSIINGTLANNSDALEKSTAGIFLMYSDTTKEDYYASYCTGVLAGKDVVLTAAHCLNVEAGMELHTMRVYFGSDLNLIGLNNSIVVEKAIAHPKYAEAGKVEETLNQNFDIAVLKLSKSVPTTQVVPSFLDDPRKLISASDLEMTSIGYGKVSTTEDTAGQKRRANSFIHSLVNPELPGLTQEKTYPQSSLINQVRVVDKTTPARGACEGDSGGPAFLKDVPIVFGLVQGVNSSVNEIDFVPGTENISCEKGDFNYTLIAAYVDWIQSEVGFPLNTSDKALSIAEAFAWGGLKSTPVLAPQPSQTPVPTELPDTNPKQVQTQVSNGSKVAPKSASGRTLFKVCE